MNLIPVYKNELKDGLIDLIQSQASIAYSSAIIHDLSPYKSKIVDRLLEQSKATNENQMDLFYIKSLLVSTGKNLNTDVFDTNEMWKARNTPEDKPLNIEHNPKQIIGHITGNYPIDDEGGILDNSLSEDKLPSKYHIITNSVIYKYYNDKDLMNTVSNIIENIKEWKVSMEALFSNFDYAAFDDKNNMSIIPRNDETSWLTKHLRAYGGNGEFNGYKLGRLLRNITFSGKGLTKNPANPESIIFDNATVFEKVDASLVYSEMTKKENLMSVEIETIKTQLAEANENLAKETAKRIELEKSIKDNDIKKVQAQVDSLKADLTSSTKELETSKSSLEAEVKSKAELQSKFDVASKELVEIKTKLDAIESEKVITARTETIVDKLKYTKDNAKSLVTLLANLNDEQFNKYVETAAKEIKVETPVEKTEAEIQKEKAEAAKKALETAEEDKKKASLNVGDEGDKGVEATRASIVDFISKGRKNKKEKK